MSSFDFILNKYSIAIPMESWQQNLWQKVQEIVSADGLDFLNLKKKDLPQYGGVYLITDTRNFQNEIPYYIGRSKNLGQRIYTNHLMGGLSNARLKKYLIKDPSHDWITDKDSAKEFIRQNCKVRWILEGDYKMRGYFEGYLTGLLKPQFGIYEEH